MADAFGVCGYLLRSDFAAACPGHAFCLSHQKLQADDASLQIVLSHFAQSTEDLGPTESFAHRQLRTTMDVSCPPYLDFLHGGLHMQVSHHLFPRVPRHNLRQVNVLVQDFAAKHADKGLAYHTFGFVEGNQKVLAVLRDVANQVSVLAKVAQAQARGELH